MKVEVGIDLLDMFSNGSVENFESLQSYTKLIEFKVCQKQDFSLMMCKRIKVIGGNLLCYPLKRQIVNTSLQSSKEKLQEFKLCKKLKEHKEPFPLTSCEFKNCKTRCMAFEFIASFLQHPWSAVYFCTTCCRGCCHCLTADAVLSMCHIPPVKQLYFSQLEFEKTGIQDFINSQ